MSFRAILCKTTEQGQSCTITSLEDNDLMEGDIMIDVAFSTLNYKDGLVLSGMPGIVRQYPMVPGIDLAGEVASSDHSDFPKGTKVVLNGYGLSEDHYGGYAQRARVKSEWLIKLPDNITPEQAMAIGTAGYTASLCLLTLERNGITPERGKVLVTGAAGGVGSVAIMLLAKAGYHIIVSTGRVEESDYLKKLGAAEIIPRAELSEQSGPIATPRWVGAIDSVGSHTLANVLAATDYRGCVACCGLAQGLDLPASVAPFILRNITLTGIDSVTASRAAREEAWARLARDLDMDKLAQATTKAKLDDVPKLAGDILAGKIRGRVVIDVN